MFWKKKPVKDTYKPIPTDVYKDMLGICTAWYQEEEKHAAKFANLFDSKFFKIANFNILNTNANDFSDAFTPDIDDNAFTRFLQMHTTLVTRLGKTRVLSLADDVVMSMDTLRPYVTLQEGYQTPRDVIKTYPFLIWIPTLNLIASQSSS